MLARRALVAKDSASSVSAVLANLKLSKIPALSKFAYARDTFSRSMQRHRPDRKAKRQSWKRHAQIKFSTAADIQPASRCSHSDRPGLVFGPGLAREPARTRRPVLLTFALPAAGRLAFCFGAAALAGVEGTLAGVDAFCRLLLRAGTGARKFCARLLGGEDCASWRRKSCCWRMVCCCICCFCISSTDNMSWSGSASVFLYPYGWFILGKIHLFYIVPPKIYGQYIYIYIYTT